MSTLRDEWASCAGYMVFGAILGIAVYGWTGAIVGGVVMLCIACPSPARRSSSEGK